VHAIRLDGTYDIDAGLPTRTAGYQQPCLRVDVAAGRCPAANGSDMTKPEKEDPLSRANELAELVDELDDKVANEREAEGVPGKPSDREDVDVRVSEDEPPD
jgi:hypothetical protein